MTTFMLQQGRPVRLVDQLLVVRAQATEGQQPPRVEAVTLDAHGEERPVDEVERHAGTLVLAVDQVTTIRLTPPVGDLVFASNSSYSVVIGPDSPTGDQVVLGSVNASGLSRRNLVTLQPDGNEIVVTAVAETWEPVLPPLAARARVAARAVLAQASVTGAGCVAVQVVVDGSASMRPALASGAVERALELLMGASQPISSSSRVGASLCGQSRTAFLDQRLDDFASPVVAEALKVAPSIGFRSTLVPEGGADTLTYVVTDAIPADLDPGRSDRLHLLILSAAGRRGAARHPDGVDATVIEPSADALGMDQSEVTAIVASLLSGYVRRFGVAGAASGESQGGSR